MVVPSTRLKSRVAEAVEAALDDQGSVNPAGVLSRTGRLALTGIENRRRARVPPPARR
jgi:hypothetical protein